MTTVYNGGYNAKIINAKNIKNHLTEYKKAGRLSTMKRTKTETNAEKAKRLEKNKKARERHWRKTGLYGDKTIKWMELHNWL
jgi:hypothetical protein